MNTNQPCSHITLPYLFEALGTPSNPSSFPWDSLTLCFSFATALLGAIRLKCICLCYIISLFRSLTWVCCVLSPLWRWLYLLPYTSFQSYDALFLWSLLSSILTDHCLTWNQHYISVFQSFPLTSTVSIPGKEDKVFLHSFSFISSYCFLITQMDLLSVQKSWNV